MAVRIINANTETERPLPYADAGVRAGFPSPAQNCMEASIDLNKELVRHPATTFYARIIGDSMQDAGITDGDLIVIDRSLEPREGDIVVAYIDGDFTLKRISIDAAHHCLWLLPENEKYQPIKVTEDNDFIVWGVVTYNIKRQR